MVLTSRAEAGTAIRWLEARGHGVGKALPDLKLVHVWLPRGDQQVVAELRAQPWVAHLTDQAAPVPGG